MTTIYQFRNKNTRIDEFTMLQKSNANSKILINNSFYEVIFPWNLTLKDPSTYSAEKSIRLLEAVNFEKISLFKLFVKCQHGNKNKGDPFPSCILFLLKPYSHSMVLGGLELIS